MKKRKKNLFTTLRYQQLGIERFHNQLISIASELADEKLLKNFIEPGIPVINREQTRDSATFAIDFSLDGKRIATSHTNHTVLICNAHTGKIQSILKNLQAERTVWTLQFHPADSSILALGTLNGKVLVYKNNEEIRRVNMFDPTAILNTSISITSVAFDQRDGEILVFSTNTYLVFYDWTKDEIIKKLRTEETRFVVFTPVTNLLIVSTSSPSMSLSEYLFIYNRFETLLPENVLELFLRFLNEINFAFIPAKLEELRQIWEVLKSKSKEMRSVEVNHQFHRVLNETLVCSLHRLQEFEGSLLPCVGNIDNEDEEEVEMGGIKTSEEKIEAETVILEFLTKFDEVDEGLVKQVIAKVIKFLKYAEDSNLSCWTPQNPAQYLRVWNCDRDGLPILNYNLKVIAACNVHHNCTVAVSMDKVAVFDRNIVEIISVASDKTFGSVLHVLPRISEVISLSFSPSNKFLLIIARKAWQTVFDIETGQLVDQTYAYNLTNSMASSYFNSVRWSKCNGGGIIFGYNSAKFFSTSVSYLRHGISNPKVLNRENSVGS